MDDVELRLPFGGEAKSQEPRAKPLGIGRAFARAERACSNNNNPIQFPQHRTVLNRSDNLLGWQEANIAARIIAAVTKLCSRSRVPPLSCHRWSKSNGGKRSEWIQVGGRSYGIRISESGKRTLHGNPDSSQVEADVGGRRRLSSITIKISVSTDTSKSSRSRERPSLSG